MSLPTAKPSLGGKEVFRAYKTLQHIMLHACSVHNAVCVPRAHISKHVPTSAILPSTIAVTNSKQSPCVKWR